MNEYLDEDIFRAEAITNGENPQSRIIGEFYLHKSWEVVF